MGEPDFFYDAVVIGGGPAGLTAALYLARARYRVVVVEQDSFGGQIATTTQVVNYPGVAQTGGGELTQTMLEQARRFGAELLLAEAQALDLEGDVKQVKTSRGVLSCFGVVLATGAGPRKVGFQGEERFRGRGVAYCATCDGEFFTGKQVFVVGGGYAAAEESVFLTKYASHVTILIREEDFTCAQGVAEKARAHPGITVLTRTVLVAAEGEETLTRITYKNSETGEETVVQARDGESLGVFVLAGRAPATQLVQELAVLDDRGYVLTDRTQRTSVAGLYAAGDVCAKSLRQVVTAVGDGALAATELERYAAAMQQKTGLTPEKPQERPPDPAPQSAGQTGELFTPEMLSQLNTVFAQMERPLTLKLYLDGGETSAQLRQYMQQLAALTDKLTVAVSGETIDHLPCVKLCTPDGREAGLAFHGVPGGHEFTSFVLGLYNAAGPGQSLDPVLRSRIARLNRPIRLRVLVTLSCTLCPDLVTAAQHIAALSPLVTAEVYDLNCFPDLRERYQVMSVPCLLVNDEPPMFGKKSIGQLMEHLEKL